MMTGRKPCLYYENYNAATSPLNPLYLYVGMCHSGWMAARGNTCGNSLVPPFESYILKLVL